MLNRERPQHWQEQGIHLSSAHPLLPTHFKKKEKEEITYKRAVKIC